MQENPDWDSLSNFAVRCAQAAAAAILPYFRQSLTIDAKPHPDWDPVTEGDRAGERAIRKLIEEYYPDHGINGEEYGIKVGKSPFCWSLDPVDGTRSFICGMPTWATLIGLTFHGEPMLGLMYQPFVDDLFLGSPLGAWHERGGQRQAIRTRSTATLENATAGTTAPELYRSSADQAAFQRLRQTVKLMRYGGDSYFYMMVALGHLDIALDSGLQSYDIVPLIPIIKGAGGAVGSWTGDNIADGGNVICAGSPSLLQQAMKLMKS